ncbi:hypothetical protein [Streptomyces sp. NPDC002265]|uniref:hypothetical protein n=1 Tax=Streptomyces sp. NPDC002265 TaxID=3154415 RepID=UPI0033279B18
MSHVGTGAGTGGAPGDDVLSGRAARLTELLAAALREEETDAESEKRAVAAFLAVRDLTAPPARTRRRDDWRPRPPR